MKKPILYILTFTYLAFSTGLTLNAHFCAGDLQSISFLKVSNECGKCGKKMKGCCKNVSQSYKIDDVHTISNFDFLFKAPDFQPVFIHKYDFQFPISELVASNSQINSDFSPHSNTRTPIYLRLCSFLI